jgi:hypothetical protein
MIEKSDSHLGVDGSGAPGILFTPFEEVALLTEAY